MPKNPLIDGINAIVNKHTEAMRAELHAIVPMLIAQSMGLPVTSPEDELRAATAALVPPKRKRGRPKKTEATPANGAAKKRAAPKKKVAAAKKKPALNADGTPRRGPGRPKGSKNKPKDAEPAKPEPVAKVEAVEDYDALRQKVAAVPAS